MSQRLSTLELHDYGFIAAKCELFSLFKPKPPIKFYPDTVYRGSEVIFVPTDKPYETPEELFEDTSLRRGRFVGIKGKELFISMNDEDVSYEDMCFMFDNIQQ